jgi:hypothetical protein
MRSVVWYLPSDTRTDNAFPSPHASSLTCTDHASPDHLSNNCVSNNIPNNYVSNSVPNVFADRDMQWGA